MTTLAEFWKRNKLGESINLSKLIEITQEPYTRLVIRPDSAISNHRNKELAAMVSDLWRPLLKRFAWTDTHIIYNNLPRCIYEVHMDRGKIYFSLSVPEIYGQQLLRRASTIWDRATIVAEPIKLKEIDAENLTVLSMQYKRNQIYSLNIHRDVDVLKSWLEASNCLVADDWAKVIVHTTPIDRLEWQRLYRKLWDGLKKGMPPPDGNSHLTMIAGAIRDLLHSLLFGIGEALGKKPEENSNYVNPDTEAGSMAIARLSSETRRKGDNPPLKTRMWVASYSKDEVRSRSTAQLIAAGFGDMSGDNELESMEVGKKDAVNWLTETKHPVISPGMIMSHDEIGQLWRLPNRELQDTYLTIDSVRQREVTLPEELFGPGIPIGKVTEKGVTRLASIPTKDQDILCRPWISIGPMGSGKTVLGVNTALAYLRQGMTVFFIDMADGDAIDTIRDALPEEFQDNHIIELDFGNIHYPVGLDMSDVASRLGQGDELEALMTADKLTEHVAYFINTMANSEGGEGFSPRMDYYFQAAGRSVLGMPGHGMMDLILALSSSGYREQILERVKDQPEVYAALADLQARSGKKEDTSKSIVQPILERINRLCNQRQLANIFLQPPNENIDFRRWMDEGGHFVGIRVPKGVLGRDNVTRIVTFLVAKLWLATLTRADVPPEQRKPFGWITDEPHNFIDGVGHLLDDLSVECRKYRMAPMWLGHGIKQFGEHFASLTSGGCKLSLFRTETLNDMKALGHMLAPYTAEEAYQQLPKRWATINRVDLPNADDVPAFMAKTEPPPKRVKDRSYRRVECAQIYGRPWKEVVDYIMEKREWLIKDVEKKKAK